jgi:hypothetical protein
MFVDLLRGRDSSAHSSSAYDHIAKLFRPIGHLLASCKRENDPFWKEANKKLEMREFEEISLGHSSRGTARSGYGIELK